MQLLTNAQSVALQTHYDTGYTKEDFFVSLLPEMYSACQILWRTNNESVMTVGRGFCPGMFSVRLLFSDMTGLLHSNLMRCHVILVQSQTIPQNNHYVIDIFDLHYLVKYSLRDVFNVISCKIVCFCITVRIQLSMLCGQSSNVDWTGSFFSLDLVLIQFIQIELNSKISASVISEWLTY